jgi:hypothetical protein
MFISYEQTVINSEMYILPQSLKTLQVYFTLNMAFVCTPQDGYTC